MDECKYTSYEECKHATDTPADCVADPTGTTPAPELASGVAPYCIVTWGTECKYYDYETCHNTAEKQVGFCYLNPDYKAPEKQ